MTDYIICIPSYKRAEICKNKTLTMLKNNNIDKSLIYIFVADKQEYDIYENILPKNMYQKLVIGLLGIVEQREFIERYFEEGKKIILFDDDVEEIDLSISELFNNNDLDYFFTKAFDIIKKEKCFIWGVYPVYNSYFRINRKEYTTNLSYIVGGFYGIINRPNMKSLECEISKEFGGQKEDVERSIKYFIQDGKIVRFNKIGYKTKYYGSVGGLGTFKERLKPMLEASHTLEYFYPEYGKVVTRKNGMTEFKLNKLNYTR